MAPRFSVVIDNYNYGRFLPGALDSVLSQGPGPGELEVIVVDDGSTDESREVLASYGSRVRSILLARGGQATAFNIALDSARGDIVCLLDADDVWLPGKLAAVEEALRDPAAGAAQNLLLDTDASLRPLPRRRPAWPARYRLEDALAGRLELTATSGLSFRREVLRRCLPMHRDIFYYIDDYLLVRSLFFAEAANIPRVLGYHRVHGGNASGGVYEDAAKIERDFFYRELFRSERAKWLAEAGRKLAPEAAAAEELEDLRRRILSASLRARPAEAWALWVAAAAKFRGLAPARARLATTLLAAASPSLYLALYGLFARARARGNALAA